MADLTPDPMAFQVALLLQLYGSFFHAPGGESAITRPAKSGIEMDGLGKIYPHDVPIFLLTMTVSLLHYLAVSQNGAPPIDYPYVYFAPSNTGIASGFDLNNNGAAVTTPGAPGYGDDALGFGAFPGQFGMVIFSRYPIEAEGVRAQTKLPVAIVPVAPVMSSSRSSPSSKPAVVRLIAR
jgi:hypothetical protein